MSDPGAHKRSFAVVHWMFSLFGHHGHFVMELQICIFTFFPVFWPQDVNLDVTEWDACSALQTSCRHLCFDIDIFSTSIECVRI